MAWSDAARAAALEARRMHMKGKNAITSGSVNRKTLTLHSSMFHVRPAGANFVAYDAHGTRVPFRSEKAAFLWAHRRNKIHLSK